ncbi:C-C motif chemokine 17 [Struthio camelus]|uniref:C-C motif chemokine 17 n=1 Tax=Struthio camelus TaxID=8801 RepID=UPI00051E5B21|nr:PREDICTED: C-C motif chemokine 5-like [Struthio camelus australis]
MQHPKKSACTTATLGLLLLFFLPSQHCVENQVMSCCFAYLKAPIRIHHLRRFYETPGYCALPAVVFVTARGAEVCADPKRAWVNKAMEKLSREN